MLFPELNEDIGTCEPGYCDKCMGDYDYDTDCSNGLKFFQRHDFSEVPGCINGGINDIEGVDFCFKPIPIVAGELNYIGK